MSQSAPPLPVPLGTHVGDWRLERELGRGGQAVVCLGRRHDGQLAAVKLPLAGHVDRLSREAEALRRLRHRHIVRLLDAELGGARPYLVLEYAPGGDLAARLRENPEGLPPEEVLAILRAILQALQHAHEQGVLHRDLKPGNVLFDGEGKCKLGDFGAGKVVQGLERSRDLRTRTRVVGTPAYIAPEIEDPRFRQGGEVDARADLYSVGKLVYTMLTGLPPRTIKPLSRVRPGLDPAWETLIFGLVEEDRERRPRSAKAVTLSLRSLAERLERRGSVQRSVQSYQASRNSLQRFDRDSAAQLPARPPTGIRVVASNRRLRLTVRYFRLPWFLLYLIVAAILWFVGPFIVTVLGEPGYALSLPFVLRVAAAGSVYLALTELCNRTTLRVRDGRLYTRAWPLPMLPFGSVRLADVKSFLCTYRISRHATRSQRYGNYDGEEMKVLHGYQVGVRTARSRFSSLVSVAEYDHAAYIIDRIRAWVKEHAPEHYREQLDIVCTSAGG